MRQALVWNFPIDVTFKSTNPYGCECAGAPQGHPGWGGAPPGPSARSSSLPVPSALGAVLPPGHFPRLPAATPTPVRGQAVGLSFRKLGANRVVPQPAALGGSMPREGRARGRGPPQSLSLPSCVVCHLHLPGTPLSRPSEPWLGRSRCHL